MQNNALPSTLAELRKTNIISPLLQAAVAARPIPATTTFQDTKAKRVERFAHLASLRHLMPVPGPIPDDVSESEIKVAADDGSGYEINVVLYRPTERTRQKLKRESDDLPPLALLVHEGGWSTGDTTDEEFNARLLVRELGIVCLNIEYRLAPEHPFPTGVLDCWAVLKWAVNPKNAASISADPSKGIVVGGSSAGGNISAILAQLSRNERLSPPVTGQWLSVPYLIPHEHLPQKYEEVFISPKENMDDPVLAGMNTERMEALLRNIVKADVQSPLWSVLAPSYYPRRKSDGASPPLARAFFQIAGMDPLRDHALVYNRILKEEYGVETRVELYDGVGHMFWTNWPELDVSKQYAVDLVNGFRWLLGIQ